MLLGENEFGHIVSHESLKDGFEDFINLYQHLNESKIRELEIASGLKPSKGLILHDEREVIFRNDRIMFTCRASVEVNGRWIITSFDIILTDDGNIHIQWEF